MLEFERQFNLKIDKKAKKIINETFVKLKKERDSKEVAYYSLPDNTKPLMKSINNYIKNNSDLKKNNIKNIVLIGIGGSSLGTKAIDAILGFKNSSTIKLLFLENADPLNIEAILKDISKENTIFIIISKSGTTIETISIFKYVLNKFQIDLDKNDTSKLIVITDKKSPLWEFALKHDIKRFSIPKNVGGRFSILSAVGLVPLAIAGYDVKKIVEGALNFENDFFDNKKHTHLLEKAYFYYKQRENKPINVLFSYASNFNYFNQWYVQLWGESLGKFDKTYKKVGLTPIGLIGSIDQHSFLQLVMQGPEDKTVTFLKINDFEKDLTIPDVKLEHISEVDYINNHTFGELINAQCIATLESMSEAGIPVDLISINKLSEENLGCLIYYYELLTSTVGIMFGINTYDQPGVEFGKKKLIKKFVKKS